MLDRYDAFFGLCDVQLAVTDRTVFDLATSLRAQYGLKTPDAIHLAAAITARSDEFWTNDDRLAKAATGDIRITIFDQAA